MLTGFAKFPDNANLRLCSQSSRQIDGYVATSTSYFDAQVLFDSLNSGASLIDKMVLGLETKPFVHTWTTYL
jgi:hypothetical protein